MRLIGDETSALMAPVHHYGKNPESGLRGASAWRGCADVVEGVLADIDLLSGRASNRELVCTKARDGEQGPLSPFKLEFITLGLDSDREPYGNCCVVPQEGSSRFDKAAGRGSKGQRAMQDAIAEALDGRGKMISSRADMAPVRAVKVIDIRQNLIADMSSMRPTPSRPPTPSAWRSSGRSIICRRHSLGPGRLKERIGCGEFKDGHEEGSPRTAHTAHPYRGCACVRSGSDLSHMFEHMRSCAVRMCRTPGPHSRTTPRRCRIWAPTT